MSEPTYNSAPWLPLFAAKRNGYAMGADWVDSLEGEELLVSIFFQTDGHTEFVGRADPSPAERAAALYRVRRALFPELDTLSDKLNDHPSVTDAVLVTE